MAVKGLNEEAAFFRRLLLLVAAAHWLMRNQEGCRSRLLLTMIHFRHHLLFSKNSTGMKINPQDC